MIDNTHARRPVTVPNPIDYSKKIDAAREFLSKRASPATRSMVVRVDGRLPSSDSERKAILKALRESLDGRQSL